MSQQKESELHLHEAGTCTCGCGHNHEEHEHHHDDDCCCGCGHDHEHEHEHHHDDDCHCDCDHDHEEYEHEHEHHCHDDCDCGHDHEEHDHAHMHHHSDDGYPRTIFILENLGCAHCASKMEEQIQALPGVASATITYATRQLRLSAENPDELLPEIQKICTSIESQVKVVPRVPKTESQPGKHSAPEHTDEHSSHAHNHSNHGSSGEDHEENENKELISIVVGAVLFVAGIVLEHIGFGEPVYLSVFIVAYLILGGEILREATRNIMHGQIFDENFLMSVATLGAFGLRVFGAQEYAEAVGVMLFYRIGEFFEHKAVDRSRGQIMDAVDMRPEVVNLLHGKEVQVIPAGEAQAGDLLLIRPGDRIPLDGVIVEGDSRLDTSPITGEPVPVAVKINDKVTSGCVNTSGQLKIRAEKPLEESMVTRILDSVENAAASKPKIDRFITRFSKIYTPCVVLIAAATAILPSLVSGNWRYWIYTALTFLVMSCPCALVLSVPLAFFSGIGAGSKKGILFKGGVSIESLGHLGAVVMDKTGTITEGNFQVQKVITASDDSEEELLRICASCEQNSTHPIAHSIVTAAAKKNLSLETPAKLEEISGHGISAQLSKGQVLCGNRKLLERYQVSIPDLSNQAYGAEVLFAVNGTFAGYLVISDTVKSDAKTSISRLKSMGLRTIMLTGDSEDSAQAVAKETGIDDVYARLLPQDKLNILNKVRSSHGSVMFVGDGINDAPVLAGADVGAAMGNGADAAIEAADAVFMNSSVDSIPQAIAIARSTNRIAIQNVVFALVIKIAVMILGLLGFANMWMAVFADTGVAMLCVMNSIRILYRKK